MDILKNKKVIAVVCNQWGDTGKGKFVDYFGDWADIIVRGTGGANAGHTIIVKDKKNNTDKKYVCHLLPSGLLYKGKLNVIGRGVAFDPRVFIEELEMFKNAGVDVTNLKVSHEAALVLPYHILMDRYGDSEQKVGTTGRGIGTCYSDYTSRHAIFVNDLLNPEVFKKKLLKYHASKLNILTKMNKELAKKLMDHDHLLKGKLWSQTDVIDPQKVIDVYLKEYAPMIAKYVTDTSALVNDYRKKGKKILLEGAQGLLLSIDYGTTKYQTSSDCSIEGLAKGSGIKEKYVDYVFGITKAFYMTRVGNGPFPTEFGGKRSEEYCDAGHTKKEETAKYGTSEASIKKLSLHPDEFMRGIAVRLIADEYGATTGRTRRCGWLDLVALKYSMNINGPNITLTKVDILKGFKTISLCVAYKYTGPTVNYAGKIFKKGDILKDFPRFSEILYCCEPVYKNFKGWTEDLSGIKKFDKLPKTLREIVLFIEKYTSGSVDVISVGPERSQTVWK